MFTLYILHYITFIHLADAFIQSNLDKHIGVLSTAPSAPLFYLYCRITVAHVI